MDYNFDLNSMFLGLGIMLIGILFTRWYKQVSDFFGRGIASYGKFRLTAILTCVAGFLISLNLHILLLNWLVGILFPK